MKTIKILLTISAALMALAGQGCSKKENNEVKNTTMVHLNAATFKEKVFNYE
jgi:hypothetical protein